MIYIHNNAIFLYSFFCVNNIRCLITFTYKLVVDIRSFLRRKLNDRILRINKFSANVSS